MFSANSPLVTCMMPTYGRPALLGESVAFFLSQDYPNKELIILNDCRGQVFECDAPGVRVMNLPRRFRSLGEKRNAIIEAAKGDVIAVWDDDDVYLPWHLSVSIREMQRHDTPFYRPDSFWAYWGESELHVNRSVPGWVGHGMILFQKSLWQACGRYPLIDLGEDALFLKAIHEHIGKDFLAYANAPEDRSFILRGLSPYHHMSISGGQRPLDAKPGNFRLMPVQIKDHKLRKSYDSLVVSHPRQSSDAFRPECPAPMSYCVDGIAKPALSVCVALKNRSRRLHEGRPIVLFPNCVRSLADAAAQIGGIELVIADFGSTDWPLTEWIRGMAGDMNVKIINMEGNFSRGRGLNTAVRQAGSDRLMLIDADLTMTRGVIENCLECLEKEHAWFPIMLQLKPDGSPDFWQDYGFGIVGLHRWAFETAKGMPEFESWGGEDNILFDRVSRLVPFKRDRLDGLLHQWHPDSWRDEHYSRVRKSDYCSYRTMPKRIHSFAAYHPHWQGQSNSIHLYEDGYMERPGVDAGEYELEEGARLLLKWDRWPTEELLYHEESKEYRDATKPFVLRQSAEGGS